MLIDLFKITAFAAVSLMLFASFGAAQDVVFDYKQPKNGTDAVEPTSIDPEDFDPDLPLAKLVFAPGFDNDSPEMQGWDNDPNDEQLYFYGVIAASGRQYGWWADNFHTIESARAHVLEWCNLDVPDDEPPCEIIAEILPDESVVDLVEGLSAAANLGYADYLKNRNNKIFAISPNGAWGRVTNSSDPVEAENDAISTCEEYAQQETTPTIIDNTCYVFDRNGSGPLDE